MWPTHKPSRLACWNDRIYRKGAMHMCPHTPPCPPPSAPDREAAHTVVAHPEQGWSLLCNGVVFFEDTGGLLPDGAMHRASPAHGHRCLRQTRQGRTRQGPGSCRRSSLRALFPEVISGVSPISYPHSFSWPRRRCRDQGELPNNYLLVLAFMQQK
jgi:hypothetical protein